MRIGTVIGTLSAAGVATLIVLSQMSDDELALTAAETTPVTAFAGGSTSTTSTSTTRPAPTTTSSTTTTLPPTTTTSSSSTTTTTTLVPINPPDVTIRIINGGGSKGAAGMIKAYMAGLGFVVRAEKTAKQNVAGTTVMWAPGKEVEARGVAARLPVPVQNIVEGVGPNWDTYGAGNVDVLVIVGP